MCLKILFPFKAQRHALISTRPLLFPHSFLDEHLACFHLLTTANTAAMNAGARKSAQVPTSILSCTHPDVGSPGHVVMLRFTLSRNRHPVFHS